MVITFRNCFLYLRKHSRMVFILGLITFLCSFMLYNICKVSKEGLKAKGSKPKSSTAKVNKPKPAKKLSKKQQLAANKAAATAAAEDKNKKAAADEEKNKKTAADEEKNKKTAADEEKKTKDAAEQNRLAQKKANGGYDTLEQVTAALSGSGYQTITEFDAAAVANGFDNAADFASKAAKYDFSAQDFLADAKRNNFNTAKEYADAYAIAYQNNYENPKNMRQGEAQKTAIVTAKATPKLVATYYSNGAYITGGLNSLQNLQTNLATVINYQPSSNATVNSLRTALNTQPSWWNYDKSSWDNLSIEEKTKNIIDVGSW